MIKSVVISDVQLEFILTHNGGLQYIDIDQGTEMIGSTIVLLSQWFSSLETLSIESSMASLTLDTLASHFISSITSNPERYNNLCILKLSFGDPRNEKEYKRSLNELCQARPDILLECWIGLHEYIYGQQFTDTIITQEIENFDEDTIQKVNNNPAILKRAKTLLSKSLQQKLQSKQRAPKFKGSSRNVITNDQEQESSEDENQEYNPVRPKPLDQVDGIDNEDSNNEEIIIDEAKYDTPHFEDSKLGATHVFALNSPENQMLYPIDDQNYERNFRIIGQDTFNEHYLNNIENDQEEVVQEIYYSESDDSHVISQFMNEVIENAVNQAESNKKIKKLDTRNSDDNFDINRLLSFRKDEENNLHNRLIKYTDDDESSAPPRQIMSKQNKAPEIVILYLYGYSFINNLYKKFLGYY